jgi:hypothetical protein
MIPVTYQALRCMDLPGGGWRSVDMAPRVVNLMFKQKGKQRCK